jgi:hypothetical protein
MNQFRNKNMRGDDELWLIIFIQSVTLNILSQIESLGMGYIEQVNAVIRHYYNKDKCLSQYSHFNSILILQVKLEPAKV